MASILIPGGLRMEVLMPSYSHWGFNRQPTEEVTALTPTFVAGGPYDYYDDGHLGCEAMIGELNLDSGVGKSRESSFVNSGL
jgi:hypothetical protein